jgi:hypothetical protein
MLLTITTTRSPATGVCSKFGYAVRLAPLGDEDPALGAPSQMAVFTREK